MTPRVRTAFRISDAIRTTSKPPIPQAFEWAKGYVATDVRPLLDMSQGVPGTPPPANLLAALGKASASPVTFGYLPDTRGHLELKKAMVEEMKVRYGQETDVTHEDMVITAGCNLAFVTVATSLADAGDEIILPVPWYFNHEMSLTMLGIKPVLLYTSPNEGFHPSPERCAELITSKTRAIVLVTPNNPTGAIYPRNLIASFANLARERNIALIIDETYRDFLLTGPPHRLFSPSPSPSSSIEEILPQDWNWRTTFIHLFSFSKSYCIPGHRLGMICASPEIIPSLATALDNMQICAPRPPQIALAPLLSSLRPFVQEITGAVAHRHTLFKKYLPPRWTIGSQGGYYAFVRHPFVGVSAAEVCKRLAQELGVVTLPGGFFRPPYLNSNGDDKDMDGSKEEEDRWIRFSVANVDDRKVVLVCGRLLESEKVFGWRLNRTSR